MRQRAAPEPIDIIEKASTFVGPLHDKIKLNESITAICAAIFSEKDNGFKGG